MERLTNAEHEIMLYLWELERCTIRDIIAATGDENLPHSTVSSVVRLLEKKGYVGHKAYGKTYEYFPLVKKSQYGKRTLSQMLNDFFNNSPKALVSFLVNEKKLSAGELKALAEELEKLKPES